MTLSTPLAHDRVEHHDAAGIPVVTILIGDGEPWDRWAEYRTRFGIGRQKSVARHIGLFIDFLAARGAEFMPLEERGKLLQAFADALAMGTIQVDGTDPTELRWRPLSAREARLALNDLTAFGDWLEEKGYAPAVNPIRQATLAEQLVFWKRWSHVKSGSLLAHIKIRSRDWERSQIAHQAKVQKQNVYTRDIAKAFPNEAITSLIRDGFSGRPPNLRWTTIRDQLIVLLLHFGGKRISEALQMWVCDVEPNSQDPTRCIPWIPHPTDSLIDWTDPLTNARRRISRQEFLLQKYGIKPLTLKTGAPRVGWKNPMMTDDKRMRVFWNDASADRLFITLYREYIKRRPIIHRHPFLFITQFGEPMTVKAYEKVHAAAVRRIGLIPAKHHGTTPHGHRHTYGHEAEAREVGTKILQVALGHKSPLSQHVYKNGDSDAVAEQMLAGEERLLNIKLEKFLP